MIKISVIITSYNNFHNIKKCLNSLFKQNYNRNIVDLEIIFVDSGSTDSSIKILNKYKNKVEIILKPQHSLRLSPAIARNIGAQNARGNILIFSDADCIFPSDWIEKIFLTFKNQTIDSILGSRIPDIGQGLGTFYRRYDFILYSRKFRISRTILINQKTVQEGTPLILIAANNFAIKRKIWEKIGGMKTCFNKPAGEDILMELELLKSGYNILFVPDIKVLHYHPLSLKKLLKKAFYQGESVNIITKYSGGYIKWKHFLQISFHFKNILISILFFIIVILMDIPSWIKVFIFSTFFFMLMINRLTQLGTILRLVLETRNKEYRKIYQLSFFQLFYFDFIRFFVKSMRLLGFIYSRFKIKSIINI